MIETEFECRLIISKEKYEKLFLFCEEKFGSVKEIVQTNFYLDTKDLDISKSGDVLRIRTVQGKPGSVITYKQKGLNGDIEFTQILTSNANISTLINDGILPDGDALKELRNKGVNTTRFYYCGEITTSRREYSDGNCLIVLDKNEYSHTIDFNLEVESVSKNEAIEKVRKICDMFSIEFTSDNTPKSKRVIEAYLKEKNQDN